MPVDARVGAHPRSRKAVASIARLLDHERLKTQPQALFLAREDEVLARAPGFRLRSELEKPRAGHDGRAFYRLNAFGRGHLGQPRALARRDPATVDQDVHTPAPELERCDDLVSDRTVHHFVVEEKCIACNEGTARRNAAALETCGV